MNIYKIKAQRIGIEIRPSKNKTKKFDAYKNGIKQASFGARGYMDYEKYITKCGLLKAKKKRTAYRARHKDNINIKKRHGKYTAGYLSNKILW